MQKPTLLTENRAFCAIQGLDLRAHKLEREVPSNSEIRRPFFQGEHPDLSGNR